MNTQYNGPICPSVSPSKLLPKRKIKLHIMDIERGYTKTCHVGFMVYRQITVPSLTPITNFKPKKLHHTEN